MADDDWSRDKNKDFMLARLDVKLDSLEKMVAALTGHLKEHIESEEKVFKEIRENQQHDRLKLAEVMVLVKERMKADSFKLESLAKKVEEQQKDLDELGTDNTKSKLYFGLIIFMSTVLITAMAAALVNKYVSSEDLNGRERNERTFNSVK